jgi:hypothetical protein
MNSDNAECVILGNVQVFNLYLTVRIEHYLNVIILFPFV